MLNLRDAESLNFELKNIVAPGVAVIFSGNDIRDRDFIQVNRDVIIKTMIYTWFNQRFVKTLSDADIALGVRDGWLREIKSADGIGWLHNALNRGDAVYDFVPEKFQGRIVDKIRGVWDFMYSLGDMYITRELSSPNTKVRIPFMTTINELGTFDDVVAQSEIWRQAQLKKQNKNAKTSDGTVHFVSLGRGYHVVELMTPYALDVESELMGHCVGQGDYDAGVINRTNRIFSLRDSKGIAHVTFSVIDNAIQQCRGHSNKVPLSKYIPFVRQFVSKSGFVPAVDYLFNMCFVRDVNGVVHDVYNLPPNISVDNLGLQGTYGIKLPSGLQCRRLNLSGARNFVLRDDIRVGTLDLSDTRNVKIVPGIVTKLLILTGAKGFVFPSYLSVPELCAENFDGLKLTGQINCQKLSVQGSSNFTLPSTLVADEINMSRCKNVRLVPGVQCKKINLSFAQDFVLPDNFHVDEINAVCVSNVNMSRGLYCRDLNLYKAKHISFSGDTHIGILRINSAENARLDKSVHCDEIHATYSKNVVIGDGVTANFLDVTGAENIKISPNAKIAVIKGLNTSHMSDAPQVKQEFRNLWEYGR